MRFPDRFFKPLKRNLLEVRPSRLKQQPLTKREASIKLVKRYIRLIK